MIFIHINMIIKLLKHCWITPYKPSWRWWLSCIVNILLVIIAIILLCLIFTFICKKLFKCTGQIGDTIGGITAPIIGLISIWLLYITFREQRRFNKKQVEFNSLMTIKNLEDKIWEKLDNLVITHDDKTYMGFDRIVANKDCIKDIKEQDLIPFMTNLIYIHRSIRMFLLTNKDAQLKKRTKITYYKIVKDIASNMIEIYSILEENHKITDSSSWRDLIKELNRYLNECNPEKQE